MKNIKKKGGRPLKKHAKLFPYIIFGFIFAVFITLKMSYKSDNKIVLQSEATVHKLKERKYSRDDYEELPRGKISLPKVNLSENIVEITNPPITRRLTMKSRQEVEESMESIVEKTLAMSDDDRSRFWDLQIARKQFSETAPNPYFVFHNKLPKSGSTTMNTILLNLSKKNKFNFEKLSPIDLPEHKIRQLARYTNTRINNQTYYLLLKHEFYFNFTKYNGSQPTFINVARDPISWFSSKYYFRHNGWERKPRQRTQFNKSKENESLDECIANKESDCTNSPAYIRFFCGIEDVCSLSNKSSKQRAAEIAKYNILHNFYVIGVLEQFEETLMLFEKVLPEYYKNDYIAWKSPGTQKAQKSTRTINKKKMTEKSRRYLTSFLKEELEVYEFIKKVFNKQLRDNNIVSSYH